MTDTAIINNMLSAPLNKYIFVICIFSKRQRIHQPALRVWHSDEPHPQEEVNNVQ